VDRAAARGVVCDHEHSPKVKPACEEGVGGHLVRVDRGHAQEVPNTAWVEVLQDIGGRDGRAAGEDLQRVLGLIIGTAPPGAWLRSGRPSPVQGESEVPTTPNTRGVFANSCAFAMHFAKSNVPACGVESSHDW
jgi:hypothetical protein